MRFPYPAPFICALYLNEYSPVQSVFCWLAQELGKEEWPLNEEGNYIQLLPSVRANAFGPLS